MGRPTGQKFVAITGASGGIGRATVTRSNSSGVMSMNRAKTEVKANLWAAADDEGGRDFGAHGIFDSRSHPRSAQLWASHHHEALAAVAGVALGARFLLRRLAA